ncbi:arogenate dehydratase/prephenate dehydratase 6, chloroplastic-like [Typha latifolia]|uniref:arogenate dehydratase/prephenate dehydratase 6, chloroplastic-like n=1 Tax=Typha latifolia TaxID=4733 RepID=UPI003C2D2347
MALNFPPSYYQTPLLRHNTIKANLDSTSPASSRVLNVTPPTTTSPLHIAEDIASRFSIELDSRLPRVAYSREAAVASAFFSTASVPCSYAEDAFAAVEDGAADLAVIPIENSRDGAIHRNLDLLLRHPYIRIVGEFIVPVDDEFNYRFLQVGLELNARVAVPGTPTKTTIAFSLKNGVSDLVRVMWVFEMRGVRVIRIDHRPNRSAPVRVVERKDGAGEATYFDYVFVLDVEGSASEPNLEKAIERLMEVAGFVRVLGSYVST